MIGKNIAAKIESNKNYSKSNVKQLIALSPNDNELVSIEDTVYRIFNKNRIENNGVTRLRRDLVLGEEGSTLTVVLWDKSCELVDTLLVQRGDKVLISNLKVRTIQDSIELINTAGTYISRVIPTEIDVKTDFSSLNGNEKNIDILGRILSVSPIRYFKDLDGKQNGISECTISDGFVEGRVTLWKSSSGYANEMHPGSYIKIEYCSIKKIEDKLDITANDYSRILLGQGLTPKTNRKNIKK
jgi:ssDNA-binding replication factor A large subunit